MAAVDIELTTADIAATLQCSHECSSDILARDGTPRYPDLPSGLTVQHIVDDMCHGRYIDNRYNCASKVLLPLCLSERILVFHSSAHLEPDTQVLGRGD
jgi:hypothetical protein